MSYKTIFIASGLVGIFLSILIVFIGLLFAPSFPGDTSSNLMEIAVIGLLLGAVSMVPTFVILLLTKYIMQGISGTTSKKVQFAIYSLLAIIVIAILALSRR